MSKTEIIALFHYIPLTIFYLAALPVPPSVIVVQPRVRYVNMGDSATFTCNASGTPSPNITWHRSGKEVSGSRYILIQTAESSQLTIKSVSHADSGFYVCQASSNGLKPANVSYSLGVIKGTCTM